MRAAVLSGPGEMALEGRDLPEPLADQALLAPLRVGICGTDLHIFQGHFGSRVPPGSVLGHETLCEVISAPPGSGLREGQRAVVDPVVSCGRCRACEIGAYYICANLRLMGVDTPGGLQERWAVPAANVIPVPDSMDDATAAMMEPLTVAVHDVNRTGVAAGDRVLVIGGGPIGALVALVCRERGAEVKLTEPNVARADLVGSLGIEILAGADPRSAIETWAPGGADIAFEVSGVQAGVDLAVAAVRPWGKVSVVAIHAEPRTMDLRQFFLRELTLIGNRLYTRSAWHEAVALASGGRLPVAALVTDTVALDGVGDAMRRALAGGAGMKTLVDVRR